MNSILGISLNNILVEKGQDHDKIFAEILMDKNKIGELVNDGWCDEYYIEFFGEDSENEFEMRLRKYYNKKKVDTANYDIFIKDLLFISKEYKAIKDTKLNCEQLTFLWE
jgi:hypothetical protein